MQDDQKMASRLANTMFNSLKGRPVQVSIFYQVGEFIFKNRDITQLVAGSHISR